VRARVRGGLSRACALAPAHGSACAAADDGDTGVLARTLNRVVPDRPVVVVIVVTVVPSLAALETPSSSSLFTMPSRIAMMPSCERRRTRVNITIDDGRRRYDEYIY